MKVNFYNKLRRKLKFDYSQTQKIIKQAADCLKLRNKELTVLLVGDSRIRTLNKKFRNKDKITDVLSFESGEKDYLGEIIIDYNQVLRQAKKYDQTAVQEYSLLLVHGLLHLMGYDHEKKSDYLKMKQKEDLILAKIYGQN